MLATMSPELKKRVGTGVAGVAVFFLLIIFGGMIGIYILTGVLILGMIHEFVSITFRLPDKQEKLYALLLLAWFLVIVDFFVGSGFRLEGLVMCFGLLSIYFLYSAGRYED